MEQQQTTWFYYAIIFVVGMAAGSITFAAAPQAAAPQAAHAVSR
jgi:uncharacterized membrane-anchored protein YhcB (DUF1043 family)